MPDIGNSLTSSWKERSKTDGTSQTLRLAGTTVIEKLASRADRGLRCIVQYRPLVKPAKQILLATIVNGSVVGTWP